MKTNKKFGLMLFFELTAPVGKLKQKGKSHNYVDSEL